MSQENVEIVQASFEAWNAGDMDAFRELHHPDAILRMAESWPEPGPYFGRDAVMREYKQLRDTWKGDASELIGDPIDAGDRVVVRFIWRGAGHGPESKMDFTVVYTVRKGSILVAEYFLDQAEALEAVGLSEEAMSEQNVEIVRQHIEAWSAEDATLALSFLDPYIVMDLSRTGAWAVDEALYGPEAVAEHFRRYAGTFEDYRWAVQRLTDLGAGAVLVVATESGRGKGSGASVERTMAVLYTVVDGKIVRITFFDDEREALEAAGLSE